MSPNTKGPKFAWLDPTSIYINAAAFGDLLDDLCAELDADEIDVVGGLDAMGFVLGAALAARLGRGFLPIRKAGKLASTPTGWSSPTIRAARRAWRCACPPSRRERACCWSTSGSRPAAPWPAPSIWSSARKASSSDSVSVNIRQNEFFTLLGPSGCGKTTLLRLIAGFDQPTAGNILLMGEDISLLPPYQRPVNTVFQSYALFPHMTVAENIGFGLLMQGKPKQEIDQTVERMLTWFRCRS
jgi:ABC-type multidrug transport system fused ATPase/permease subunit